MNAVKRVMKKEHQYRQGVCSYILQGVSFKERRMPIACNKAQFTLTKKLNLRNVVLKQTCGGWECDPRRRPPIKAPKAHHHVPTHALLRFCEVRSGPG